MQMRERYFSPCFPFKKEVVSLEAAADIHRKRRQTSRRRQQWKEAVIKWKAAFIFISVHKEWLGN